MPHVNCPTVRRALALHRKGLSRAAIDILELALAASPDRGDWRQLRACLLHAAGRYVDALDEIEQAQLLTPLTPRGRVVLARGLLEVGRRELALDVFREVAQQPRLSRCVRAALCSGLSTAGATEDALAVARQAADAAPHDDQAHYAIAILLRRLKRPPELAAAVLRRAIALAPENPRYRRSLAFLLMDCDDSDAAYREIAKLPDESWRAVRCAACLDRVLQLCCRMGDTARSQLLAAELASRFARRREQGRQP